MKDKMKEEENKLTNRSLSVHQNQLKLIKQEVIPEIRYFNNESTRRH